MGRGKTLQPLSAEGIEDVLEFLYEAATVIPLKTTEAPQYRRIVLRHGTGAPVGPGRAGSALPGALRPSRRPRAAPTGPDGSAPTPPAPSGGRRRPPLVVGDGQGVVFVSSRGDVQPSGFLPLVAGNVRDRRLPEIYSGSELFRSLRDPDRLLGRCGRCEYREPCGGSRARAFAASGNPLAEDPGCPYQPRGGRARAAGTDAATRRSPRGARP